MRDTHVRDTHEGELGVKKEEKIRGWVGGDGRNKHKSPN